MQIPVVPVKAAGGLLEEFRAFLVRGTLVDMAVGVVAGAAFSRLIDALVKHVVMPAMTYVLPEARSYEGWVVGTIEVGRFLAELLNFLVVGFAVFFVIVKVGGLLTRTRQQQHQRQREAELAAAKAAPKGSPADVVLLTEIRDLLRQQHQFLRARAATPPAPTFEFKTGDDNLLL